MLLYGDGSKGVSNPTLQATARAPTERIANKWLVPALPTYRSGINKDMEVLTKITEAGLGLESALRGCHTSHFKERCRRRYEESGRWKSCR